MLFSSAFGFSFKVSSHKSEVAKDDSCSVFGWNDLDRKILSEVTN